VAVPRVLPEAQAWALGGGRFAPQELPRWVQADAIEAVAGDCTRLGGWVSHGFSTKVAIGLTNSTSLRCAAIRCRPDEYLCLIPVGLVLRLDYLMRVLEREHGQERIHIVDPDFHGDLPESIRRERDERSPPEPILTITHESRECAEFFAKLKYIDDDDQLRGRSPNRKVQIDQIRLSVCFCALHESAHALRRHADILDGSKERAADERAAELDADARAGMWLSLYRFAELVMNVGTDDPAFFFDTLAESAWRITYSAAVVLGLFDIDRLAIGRFQDGSYHHPSARLQFVTNGMFMGFAANLPDEIVKRQLVSMSADAASEYMARVSHLWLKNDPEHKCRRCTSLYFPFAGADAQGEHTAPTLRRMFEEASSEYEEFLIRSEHILNSANKQEGREDDIP
jgi:hypothetical protein